MSDTDYGNRPVIPAWEQFNLESTERSRVPARTRKRLSRRRSCVDGWSSPTIRSHTWSAVISSILDPVTGDAQSECSVGRWPTKIVEINRCHTGSHITAAYRVSPFFAVLLEGIRESDLVEVGELGRFWPSSVEDHCPQLTDQSPVTGKRSTYPATLEEPIAADVLANLRDATKSADLIRKSILEAETLSFDSGQISVLKSALREYVEQNRDSPEPATLVAVASAIRKFVAILGPEEISSVGILLESGHRSSVPVELELEVSKMVVRKLSAVLPPEADPFPELARQLMDLARTYLNPRLLPRPHYGAIALNSTLALTILRVPDLMDLFDNLRRLQVPWFEQMLIRRAEALKQELTRRFPGIGANPHRESLDALVGAVRGGA